MSNPNRKECSYSEKPNDSNTISRQDAINEAEQWIKIYSSGRGGQRERDAIKQVISGIKELPSAQPEIIRCKDCKYHRRDGDGCYYCCRKDYGYGWGLNDFCSDAER